MKKSRFIAKAIKTPYWTPKINYVNIILKVLRGKIRNGDIIAISEKALSTALGNLIDEQNVKPSLLAKFIAYFWMRIVWGYFLGVLCRLKSETLIRLRNYPLSAGAKHKQVALTYVGFLQALMWGSEGGIDGSNLPYSIVSLPLKNPIEIASEIRNVVRKVFGLDISVMIVDTDRTFNFRNFYFTYRSIFYKIAIFGKTI